MEILNFKSCKEHTVGVELELQLINPETRELTSATSKILKELNNYPNIKHELFESVIEINSNPCRKISELKADLKKHVQVLYEAASKLGVKLTMAGTHPISNWAKQEISPLSRYQDIANKIQMPVKRMLVFGFHVHVGVQNGDEAILVKSGLVNYLPQLLALSTSSPYWVKRDSGMESYRVKILETLPTTGLPFRMKTWEEFCQLVHALKRAGTIESIRELWWDIRPHPGFGTVEVRVCDAVPIFDDVFSIAALVQTLVSFLARKVRNKEEIELMPSFLIRENKWRAARYGIDANLIINNNGDTLPMKDAVEKLINELKPISDELDTTTDLNNLMKIFERGTSSKRQRAIFEKTNGDLTAVIDNLINEFQDSWGLIKNASGSFNNHR